MTTSYKIAVTPQDFKNAYGFFRALNDPPVVKLSHPTILVERDGSIVGALGTMKNEYKILAGPLAINLPKGHNPGHIIIRLGQIYEALLKAANIKVYYFGIDRDKPEWIDIIRKGLNLEPYALFEGRLYFRREL